MFMELKKAIWQVTLPTKRKAQALQLQGFLLFFDQLLANYLSQLKNIRSLFAISSSENDEDNHTYYTSTLTMCLNWKNYFVSIQVLMARA